MRYSVIFFDSNVLVVFFWAELCSINRSQRLCSQPAISFFILFHFGKGEKLSKKNSPSISRVLFLLHNGRKPVQNYIRPLKNNRRPVQNRFRPFILLSIRNMGQANFYLNRVGASESFVGQRKFFIILRKLFVKPHELFIIPRKLFVKPHELFYRPRKLFVKPRELFVIPRKLFVKPRELFIGAVISYVFIQLNE